jgi:natural product biosynthesis luciferase-like monooxygenase protein
MDFSLFYFADEAIAGKQRYRLLLDGARFADSRGFAAVWTPERHFHPFGGRYPNPAVTGAAVAAVTERVAVRAGSVVAPLHHPARIAEEWSVVDNLSDGRAGVALASGWHVGDFALRPENYVRRKEVVAETVDTVRRLWRQDTVSFLDGTGRPVEVRTFPPPVQPELPMWLTSAGTLDTFRTAGELGTGLLTHLLGQELPDLAHKIAVYRQAFDAHHPDRRGRAHVVLMLHALLGDDRDEVREVVREPFSAYLRSSIGLIARAAVGAAPSFDPARLRPNDVDFLVRRSFDRYFDTGGLFGTVADGVRTVAQITELGVDEVACLIDFGVPHDTVLSGLERLDDLRRALLAGGAG